ncbi:MULTISPECIES: bifunctional (p)ppGpp synthetase/guanosine-3',5'-bis(diphosphate) 3'-pyrophosphohydrolase [unclassified Devosia]|jgi:guanosine-3',5'-bis(diphosphate) 3'-pyrophosphohydrolase|uniref:RelA/SpoT family protein n=3 Tax=Devosia TaxID=46913 RepID=UPI00086DA8E7|nr:MULTISPECIES: bifunctional (p)ppGpp synthetase/guanosine-3',5'-bis(diphosphate) 3'-pyrophosphohydrolase [unclassified Devosia]MBN9360006.1 bifunctional (p)ppGpp synthetase/guanosine-3',5'-bis(diphosphate) 3'-pyrophosphohydrolase [Devosia sp.]ODS91438.1 MAG: GTP pyrophosphokinase [Devosia sp. SCN 66-27]OJX22072.1 MAG: bifunctional (p)ppGpp synthetase/guanosine-3',5'-bis(diphosphate) 3'-pyrophosphohydrolase [Devosia sp. 66-14]
MMRQYELVERVQAYNPNTDEALLNKAYVYAMQKHGTQKRASGDPYFAHPLEVAAILTDLKLDDASIAVALLHDTIEDTDATRAEIDQLFGPEIGAIVDGLTKIDRLQLVTREEAQAENLRKLLLAISADVRVLLVKLADRLHNMRTLDFMPENKRKRIATETMDIYAPLAGRMGMQDMRQELEDLAFRVLQPDHYQAITDRLGEMKSEFADTIKTIKTELSEKLKGDGIDARVSARVKSPWSIFTKIERKQIALEQLSDMIGFRVIVPTVADCYKALGIVHTNWKVVPGRFKDYISVPKHNDYRSIHTTIVGVGRQRAELQIRTEEMHRIAELGIAAHALYKEGATDIHKIENESKAFVWLRSTISHLTAGSSTEDFLEYTKLELFQDQVFCFTPRGRLIALPRGATPIDFAYALHTDIGDTCVGAKINGQIVPLVTQLRSGDEVEIIRDQNHLPPSNWETIAATGKARAAIRRAVRQQAQARAYALGEHMVSILLEREGTGLDDGEFKALAEGLGQPSKRELLIALGEGKIGGEDLDTQVMEVKGIKRRRKKIDLPVPDKAEGWFALKATDEFRFRVPGNPRSGPRAKAALTQLDFNTRVEVSPEGVVPGDRLVGIMTPDTPITIYPIHSDALSELYDSDVAWIDVRWDLAGREEHDHPCVISMQAQNKPGSLAQISTVIAACEANIHNLVMRMESPDFHRFIFQIEVRDLAQLTDVLNSLKLTAGISDVQRASVAEARSLDRLEWTAPERQEEPA